jgi:hypothetical protein
LPVSIPMPVTPPVALPISLAIPPPVALPISMPLPTALPIPVRATEAGERIMRQLQGRG